MLTLKQGSKSAPCVRDPSSGCAACVPKLDKIEYGQVKPLYACPGWLFQCGFPKAMRTEGCRSRATRSTPVEGTSFLSVHARVCLCVEHICEMLTSSFPYKVLAVLASSFPFAAGCVSCSGVAWLQLCSLCSQSQMLVPGNLSSALQGRGNLSEEDYNLALVLPGRFSQQCKYNTRALCFLLDVALMRIAWWDTLSILHLLDYIIFAGRF